MAKNMNIFSVRAFSLLLVFLLSVGSAVAAPEKKTNKKEETTTVGQGFSEGTSYVGASLGFVYFGNSFGVGAQYEYALDDNWGLGGEFAYTSFTESYSAYTYSYEFKYTFITVLASVAYHFKIDDNPAFDPYVKLGLGYFNWDVEYSDDQGGTYGSLYDGAYSSGIGLTGAVGMRYFFAENIAARVQIGYPFLLSAGADYAF